MAFQLDRYVASDNDRTLSLFARSTSSFSSLSCRLSLLTAVATAVAANEIPRDKKRTRDDDVPVPSKHHLSPNRHPTLRQKDLKKQVTFNETSRRFLKIQPHTSGPRLQVLAAKPTISITGHVDDWSPKSVIAPPTLWEVMKDHVPPIAPFDLSTLPANYKKHVEIYGWPTPEVERTCALPAHKLQSPYQLQLNSMTSLRCHNIKELQPRLNVSQLLALHNASNGFGVCGFGAF